jgi:hypothetical protein
MKEKKTIINHEIIIIGSTLEGKLVNDINLQENRLIIPER